MQGFLAKIGLVRSYLCLNAFSYALFPSQSNQGDAILSEPAQLAWRNKLLDRAHRPAVQAIIAFGVQAQNTMDLWPGKGSTPVIVVPHPSSHDEDELLRRWRAAVVQLRGLVTADADAVANLPNYGQAFRESDYAAIPRRDLPFGAPEFLGNDAWGRAQQPRRRSSAKRPQPDDRHTLIWKAPAL